MGHLPIVEGSPLKTWEEEEEEAVAVRRRGDNTSAGDAAAPQEPRCRVTSCTMRRPYHSAAEFRPGHIPRLFVNLAARR